MEKWHFKGIFVAGDPIPFRTKINTIICCGTWAFYVPVQDHHHIVDQNDIVDDHNGVTGDQNGVLLTWCIVDDQIGTFDSNNNSVVVDRNRLLLTRKCSCWPKWCCSSLLVNSKALPDSNNLIRQQQCHSRSTTTSFLASSNNTVQVDFTNQVI